jgi:hypothetical protein
MPSPRFRRAQRQLALLTPAVLVLGVLVNSALSGWASQQLLAGVGLLVFGCSLAVCLYKRSTNRETAWFSVRIPPDPPGSELEPVNPLSPDFLLVVGAIFFMALAVVYPLLRS